MNIQLITSLPLKRLEEYKELKLQSLTIDPLAYSPGIEEYQNKTNDEWEKEFKKIQDEKSLVFIEHEGKLIGMGGVYYYKKDRFKHNAMIDSLFVSPEYRGKGFGKKLIQKLEEVIKEKGKEYIHAEVFSTQEASLCLFKKSNYEQVGLLKEYVKNEDGYADLYFFQKKCC